MNKGQKIYKKCCNTVHENNVSEATETNVPAFGSSCSLCGKICKNERGLVLHMRMMHAEQRNCSVNSADTAMSPITLFDGNKLEQQPLVGQCGCPREDVIRSSSTQPITPSGKVPDNYFWVITHTILMGSETRQTAFVCRDCIRSFSAITGRGVHEHHVQIASIHNDALKSISKSGVRWRNKEEMTEAYEEIHVTTSLASNKAFNLHLQKLF